MQPKDLPASDISVRLGATWIPAEIVEQFVYEFLDTPRWARWNIKVHFSDLQANGTSRANRMIEVTSKLIVPMAQAG